MKYIINNVEKVSIYQISRHIRPGMEVAEVQNGKPIFLGVVTKKFLTKVSADILEVSVRQFPRSEASKIAISYLAEIKSFISGDTLYLGEVPTILKVQINDYCYHAISHLSDLAKDRDRYSITDTMFCIANAALPESDRKELFLGQGEYIISSMKSGEWMFYL